MPSRLPTAAPSMNWLSTPVTVSSNYGFSAIALSNDGAYVTIGATDGKTLFSRQANGGAFTPWVSPTTAPSSTGFTSISMSLNGQYQIAVNNNISVIISSNYGLSWSTTLGENGVLAYNKKGWKYSAMSDDGSVIVLSQENSTFAIYNQATASASTWMSPPSFKILTNLHVTVASIAIDNTGNTIVCLSSTGMIYITYNQGNVWFQQSSTTSSTTSTSYVPYTMAISRSTNAEQILTVAYDRNVLYSSSNQGYSFTSITGPGNPTNIWLSLSSSYTGQYVVGSMEHGIYDTSNVGQDGVYYSSNYGSSWTMMFPLENAVTAMNPAGNFMVAVSGEIGSTRMYYYQQSGKLKQCCL